MALGTWVAGRYSTTWNATSVGISKSGFELEFVFNFEVIDETDAYARSIIDAIYQGANVYMNTTLREWKAGSTGPMWPVGGGTLGKIMSATKPVGILASDQAQSLVLTATANTPAATAPATLTASKSLIAPNYNPRIVFDSRLREVPLRMVFYPSDSTGEVTCFTTS